MNQIQIQIIKEMQTIYLEFDRKMNSYQSRWGNDWLIEIMRNMSVLGCCLSELETLMENDR